MDLGGCSSATAQDGKTIFIANAHKDDGKRYVVQADENLTAFLELERTVKKTNALSE
jgi:hypothetical protein